MISVLDFKKTLTQFIPDDDRPVIIYSGLWYLGRSFTESFSQIPRLLNEIILEIVGDKRTILMPTYTSGFKNGIINLDLEPSQTGTLTEHFRKTPGTMRTVSAFFSFAASGPEAAQLQSLRPKDAWGESSVFEWIEKSDAHLLMIGESWDACSLKHRSEWLNRVPYRSLKEFSGSVVHNGKTEKLNERLFVRSLNPNVENVWHNLDSILKAGGMRSIPFGGGQIAHMSSQSLMKQMNARLQDDPFAFTQDPNLVRKLFQ